MIASFEGKAISFNFWTRRSTSPAPIRDTSKDTFPEFGRTWQYTHAAIWSAMAFAELGNTVRAWELMSMINPVNRGGTPQELRHIESNRTLCR
jgi:hypothetical protein